MVKTPEPIGELFLRDLMRRSRSLPPCPTDFCISTVSHIYHTRPHHVVIQKVLSCTIQDPTPVFLSCEKGLIPFRA